MSIVVICVDGLPVHLLGAYGNSLLETPAIDSMAARGFVLERAFLSGDRGYRAEQIHRWMRSYSQADWEVVRFVPQPSHLATSQLDVTAVESSGSGDEIETLAIGLVESATAAEDWTECSTTIFVSQVLAQMDVMNLDSKKCIWIDLPLLNTSWDAPLNWRERLAGDDDPDVLTQVQVPSIESESEIGTLQTLDPDLRFVWEQAASAQVMLLDRCVEVIAEWVADAWPDCSLLLTAHQGFCLGEHGQIQWGSKQVYSEVAQVPFVFSAPSQTNSVRVPGVQNQSDWLDLVGQVNRQATAEELAAHLEAQSQDRFHWCRYSLFSSGDEQLEQRNAVITWSDSQVAVRTNQWTFLWNRDQAVYLFVAPDDRFEQNDVADRCRSLANMFLKNVARFGASLGHYDAALWWANADETLPVDEPIVSEEPLDDIEATTAANSDTLPANDTAEVKKQSAGQGSTEGNSCQLSDLPADFWTSVI